MKYINFENVLVFIALIMVLLGVLGLFYVVCIQCPRLEQQAQEKWRSDCRLYGGQVMKDYQGDEKCTGSKLKVIND